MQEDNEIIELCYMGKAIFIQDKKTNKMIKQDL